MVFERIKGDMLLKMEHVPGKNQGKIILYALSTCGWCAKTKQLLKDLGVDYYYVYVDLLTPDEMDRAMTEVEKFNPKGSFPTLVINDSKCIVGFREDEIREVFRT